jgi:uncharacterized DUF497 family protein
MQFEWDPAKERINLEQHGVDFPTAQAAFSDRSAIVVYDAGHSTQRELRWQLFGRVGDRILTVRFTHRPVGIIRIIGAGFWRNGRKHYETHWKTYPDQATNL